MGKGKHTGQKIHENPDLENSIPSTWDIQLWREDDSLIRSGFLA